MDLGPDLPLQYQVLHFVGHHLPSRNFHPRGLDDFVSSRSAGQLSLSEMPRERFNTAIALRVIQQSR
jgi:hypothetical protein